MEKEQEQDNGHTSSNSVPRERAGTGVQQKTRSLLPPSTVQGALRRGALPRPVPEEGLLEDPVSTGRLGPPLHPPSDGPRPPTGQPSRRGARLPETAVGAHPCHQAVQNSQGQIWILLPPLTNTVPSTNL